MYSARIMLLAALGCTALASTVHLAAQPLAPLPATERVTSLQHVMNSGGNRIRFLGDSSLHTSVPGGISFLDNGVIRIGIDLDRGGAISYLSKSGSAENVVNIHDTGRFIQQSYYSGPEPFIPSGHIQHPSYARWPWNPVQAGDVYGFHSLVLDYSNDGTTLYSRSVPKQWALDDLDSESTMETWITLEQNRAHVRCRLVNSRSDTTRYRAFSQELPAVYTVGTLYRLFTYTGSSPFTGDSLTQVASVFPWAEWNSTENWTAAVNDQGWGLGVFHPGANLTKGGFFGTPGVGGPLDNATGYISPTLLEVLDDDIVYDYEFTLILGDLYSDIRSYVYAHAPDPRPSYVFTHDRQHWYPLNVADSAPPFAGFWPLTLDQEYPAVVGPLSTWTASEVPRICIVASHHTQDSLAAVFFATSRREGFSAEKRVEFTVIPDGGVHTYTVDLSANPLYTGLISQLSFDPVVERSVGDTVDLYSVSYAPPGGCPVFQDGFEINSSLNDTWRSINTRGQGFFINVFSGTTPDRPQPVMFVGWFTYDVERPAADVTATLGEPGHRWLTAYGPYSGDTATLDIELTHGGTFDSGVPAPMQGPYGTMTVKFTNCSEGEVTYNIPSVGASGKVPITRVANDNVSLCESLEAKVQQNLD